MTERKNRIPPGYREEIYYERNPWTGKKYRRTRIVLDTDITQPPDVPPPPGTLSPEEYAAQQRQKREKDFERHQAARPDLWDD